MNDEAKTKPPVINCHAHIFKGDHVPPWLAKTFIPAPFYYFLPLNVFVKFFRWWNKYPGAIFYHSWFKKVAELYNRIQRLLNRLGFVRNILEYAAAIEIFFILYNRIKPVFPPEKTWVSGWIEAMRIWLDKYHLLLHTESWWLPLILIALVFIFLPSARNLIVFLAKILWAILGKMMGRQTKELIKRYFLIARFAFHEKQVTILDKLEKQYPENTGFVILPMDMDFMKAGNATIQYREQMLELAALKKSHSIYPFVFADPRRIHAEADYFKYTFANGKVQLEECFIKTFIEEHEFSGFKIYPALGYYPFDESLLPLWKYAADNALPIMTHCIRGVIYYRGRKKDEWNHHPFFKQAMGDDNYEPLLLPELKNVDFSANFTHPLNFLCLLYEPMLRKVVAAASDEIKKLFGYKNDDEEMLYNLDHLKICFGHYGGGDEWQRYFETDRYNHSNQLVQKPGFGIDFFQTTDGKESKGKIEQLWKYTDWYSIISSMMLQRDNVYADISYILHNTSILPLLRQTLHNPQLCEKVLFGTDFYVVRNHKSDKNMLTEMMGGLSEEYFDLIARDNPKKFLNL